MDETWGVVANVTGCSVFREGARVWVLQVPGLPSSALVYGQSRGGRRVRKWVRSKRLSNFRARMALPGTPQADWSGMKTKAEAAERAAILAARTARG